MKNSVRARLLITFALVSVVLVISTGWATRLVFQQGFIGYLNEQAIGRMEESAQLLADTYAESGSWDLLRNSPNLWRELVDGRRARQPSYVEQLSQDNFNPDDYIAAEADFDPMSFRPPRSSSAQIEPTPGPTGPSWTLLDTEGEWAGGRRLQSVEPEMLSVAVRYNGADIGYLIAPVSTGFEAVLDQTFVENQMRISVWIAILALAFVLPLALYIAARLLAPINGLTAGVNTLTRGEYGAQISVERDDELGQLARDFNKLSGTLQANKTAQQRWISDVSHELRTPVAILEGEISAILDGIRKADTKEIESLGAEVKRLSSLINDLHQLSKSDAGDLSYRMEPVNIKNILEHITYAFRNRMEEAGLSYELSVDRDDAYIFGDESRLIQLFSNLFENSCRYTDSDGKILLSLNCQAGLAVIRLSDSSPGVTDEELPQLFDRLYRVEKSRNRASGGSGLGLAICRNIANAHGATLEVSHADLGGLTLTLTMPLHRQERGDK